MKFLVLVSIFIFSILLFDLGNPDALRQGTEGFYLQVAGEMFERKSFLTPYYVNKPHWSKPPLTFLLPQILYYIKGLAGILSSRLSILIFSIFLSVIASIKVNEITKAQPYSFLLFLFSSVGFFKYSRIFMMEMPLLLLSFLSAIFFFSFLEKKKRSSMLFSILFAALSCQVKGPVSIAMLLPSFSLYAIYHFIVFKKLFIKEIIFWLICTLILSSGWFIYEYVIFGDDFINYFFLRENLGKFSAKSYPISNVFKGLFLYSLPWSFLIPAFLWKFKSSGAEKLTNLNSKFQIFLIICFGCFFTLWLVPQQRSHHYAMPAIPFLLTLIYIEFFNLKTISNYIKKIMSVYILTLSLIGFSVVSITLIYRDQFLYSNLGLLMTGAALLCVVLFLAFKKNSNKESLFVANILLISIFWSLFIPNFILPLVPDNARKAIINFQNVGVVHRKPYFISRSIGRKVKILDINGVDQYLRNKDSVIIIDGPLYILIGSASKYQILKEWIVWKRGIKAPAIFKAFSSKNFAALRSKIYLIKAK